MLGSPHGRRVAHGLPCTAQLDRPALSASCGPMRVNHPPANPVVEWLPRRTAFCIACASDCTGFKQLSVVTFSACVAALGEIHSALSKLRSSAPSAGRHRRVLRQEPRSQPICARLLLVLDKRGGTISTFASDCRSIFTCKEQWFCLNLVFEERQEQPANSLEPVRVRVALQKPREYERASTY